VIQAHGQCGFIDAQAVCSVALRVDVDQKCSLGLEGHCGGEIDGRCGFADAAFLVGNRNRLCQIKPLFSIGYDKDHITTDYYHIAGKNKRIFSVSRETQEHSGV
jgi:hypothetical protein